MCEGVSALQRRASDREAKDIRKEGDEGTTKKSQLRREEKLVRSRRDFRTRSNFIKFPGPGPRWATESCPPAAAVCRKGGRLSLLGRGIATSSCTVDASADVPSNDLAVSGSWSRGRPRGAPQPHSFILPEGVSAGGIEPFRGRRGVGERRLLVARSACRGTARKGGR